MAVEQWAIQPAEAFERGRCLVKINGSRQSVEELFYAFIDESEVPFVLQGDAVFAWGLYVQAADGDVARRLTDYLTAHSGRAAGENGGDAQPDGGDPRGAKLEITDAFWELHVGDETPQPAARAQAPEPVSPLPEQSVVQPPQRVEDEGLIKRSVIQQSFKRADEPPESPPSDNPVEMQSLLDELNTVLSDLTVSEKEGVRDRIRNQLERQPPGQPARERPADALARESPAEEQPVREEEAALPVPQQSEDLGPIRLVEERDVEFAEESSEALDTVRGPARHDTHEAAVDEDMTTQSPLPLPVGGQDDQPAAAGLLDTPALPAQPDLLPQNQQRDAQPVDITRFLEDEEVKDKMKALLDEQPTPPAASPPVDAHPVELENRDEAPTAFGQHRYTPPAQAGDTDGTELSIEEGINTEDETAAQTGENAALSSMLETCDEMAGPGGSDRDAAIPVKQDRSKERGAWLRRTGKMR